MLDSDVDRPRPPTCTARAHQRSGAFGKGNNFIGGLNERNQLAESPDSAAIDGFATQPPLMPGVAKFFRIERSKIILHFEQPAAEGAMMPPFLWVLALGAAFFNALEVGGHKRTSVVRGQLSVARDNLILAIDGILHWLDESIICSHGNDHGPLTTDY